MKSHPKTKRRLNAHHVAASATRKSHKASIPRRARAVDSAPETAHAKPQESRDKETFTAMETGQPDRDEGRGPLGQEGEGEEQNDQLAALEEIEPKLGQRDD